MVLCLSGFYTGVAQLVEQRIPNPQVAGSTPAARAFFSDSPCGVSFRDLFGESLSGIFSSELVMLYRWPQGRIIRVIFLVAVVLIAADFGFNAYGQYDAWASATEEQSVSNLVYMSILGVLGAVVLIGGVALIGFVPKAAQFLIEVEQEMSKVTWPSRSDLIRSTILIALLSVILALLIAGVDLLNYWLVYNQIIGGA